MAKRLPQHISNQIMELAKDAYDVDAIYAFMADVTIPGPDGAIKRPTMAQVKDVVRWCITKGYAEKEQLNAVPRRYYKEIWSHRPGSVIQRGQLANARSVVSVSAEDYAAAIEHNQISIHQARRPQTVDPTPAQASGNADRRKRLGQGSYTKDEQKLKQRSCPRCSGWCYSQYGNPWRCVNCGFTDYLDADPRKC